MTVTALRRSPDTLTMTIDAEFDASAERVWQLWADPRQLERWWGPPSYPATFTVHDLAPGSRVEYYMTGPTGDKPRGYWDIIETDPPRSLVFVDGFAHDDGTPNDAFPRNEARVTIEGVGEESPLEAARLTLAGICASVALGPVLPPDGSTLFGVRGAIERRDKALPTP